MKKILDFMRAIRNNFYSKILKKERIYYKKRAYLNNYSKNKKNIFMNNEEFVKPYRKLRLFNLNIVESLKRKIKSILWSF